MKKFFLPILLFLLFTSASRAEEFRHEDFSILLPPPPEVGSLQHELDEAAYENGKKLRSTPRGVEAALDADFDQIMNRFSDSFGHELSAKETPAIIALLTYSSDKLYYQLIKIQKTKFKRKRPYISHAEHTCYKKDEENHYEDHSYPSGHSASAWIIALILTELVPERAGQVIKHGFEVGQSRVICGYHWQSDVDIARPIASAFLSQLHSTNKFRILFEAAKKEVEKLR